MSPSLHPQGLAWIQQHEQRWDDLVGSKTTQLQSLFKEHLDWFRQHKSATSIVSTRRALVDTDTTDDTPMKRRRVDNQEHDQQQHQSVPLPKNEVELLHQNNNLDAPEFMIVEKEELAIVSHSDNDITDTTDNRLKSTDTPLSPKAIDTSHSSNDSNNKSTEQSVEMTTTTTTRTPTAARENLLKRFNEEEKKYGRYGLRNRSLGTARTITNLSSSPGPAEDTELQRRKTIQPIPKTDNNNNSEKQPLANDSNIPQLQTTNSLSFILSSLHEQSKVLPKKQATIEHNQEEQIDDEVQLVTRSNRNNKSILSEGGSLILGRDNNNGAQGNSKQNSFILANESSFLSRMFSFGRAGTSHLESSVLIDDGNTSILGKSDSPKRSTEIPGSRTSRLVCASPAKERTTPSPKKSTRESLLTPYLPRQLNASQPVSLAGSETPSKQSSLSAAAAVTRDDNSPQIPTTLPVDKEQDQNTGDEHQADQEDSEEVMIPSWATQPELNQLLEKQTKVDADTIFGKIPPVQVSRFVKTSH